MSTLKSKSGGSLGVFWREEIRLQHFPGPKAYPRGSEENPATGQISDSSGGLPEHPTHRTKTVKPRLPTFPGF